MNKERKIILLIFIGVICFMAFNIWNYERFHVKEGLRIIDCYDNNNNRIVVLDSGCEEVSYPDFEELGTAVQTLIGCLMVLSNMCVILLLGLGVAFMASTDEKIKDDVKTKKGE